MHSQQYFVIFRSVTAMAIIGDSPYRADGGNLGDERI
jgi:hypothetical protein